MYSDQDEASPVHLPAVSVPVQMRRPPKHAIKGTVHVPPNFLPPEAMIGQQVDTKGKQKLKDERRDELVDWLVPEKLRAEMMMEP